MNINAKAKEWIDAGLLEVHTDENGRWQWEGSFAGAVSMKRYHMKCGGCVTGAIPDDLAAKLFAGCRQDERTAPARSYAVLECSHWHQLHLQCPWFKALARERMSVSFEEQSLLGRLKFYAKILYRRRDVPCVEHANPGRVGRLLALAKRWLKRDDKPLPAPSEDGKQGRHGVEQGREQVHAS